MSARRGEGGSRIAQFCGQIRLIGCVKCGRGGGGVKNHAIFADILYVWSLISLLHSFNSFISRWIKVDISRAGCGCILPPRPDIRAGQDREGGLLRHPGMHHGLEVVTFDKVISDPTLTLHISLLQSVHRVQADLRREPHLRVRPPPWPPRRHPP